MYFDVFLFWVFPGLASEELRLRLKQFQVGVVVYFPTLQFREAAKWAGIKLAVTLPLYGLLPFSPLIFDWSPLALIAIDAKEVYMVAAAGEVPYPLFMTVVVPRMMVLDVIAQYFGRSIRKDLAAESAFDVSTDTFVWRLLRRLQMRGAWLYFYFRGGDFVSFALLMRIGVEERKIWQHNVVATTIYASVLYWVGFALKDFWSTVWMLTTRYFELLSVIWIIATIVKVVREERKITRKTIAIHVSESEEVPM